MFTFGVEPRLVAPTANPVIGVKKLRKESSRDRVLTHEEIRRIRDACETQNPHVCAWFRLRLTTAQRGGELLQMRWRDIDNKSHFWTIPAEYVKNAHGHRVYLNDLARKTPGDPMSDRASGFFRSRSWATTSMSGVDWRRARVRTSSRKRRNRHMGAIESTSAAMIFGAPRRA
jgi:integrase